MTQRNRVAQLRFLLLLSLLGVTACEPSTGCDPARAGFLEGMSCQNGGYQYRQAALEQNLAASRADALEQQAAAGRASADARTAQRDLAARRRALAQLDAHLAELRARLQAAQSRPGVNQIAVQQATVQMDDLFRQQNEISHQDPSDADLRNIEERQHKMMAVLNRL